MVLKEICIHQENICQRNEKSLPKKNFQTSYLKEICKIHYVLNGEAVSVTKKHETDNSRKNQRKVRKPKKTKGNPRKTQGPTQKIQGQALWNVQGALGNVHDMFREPAEMLKKHENSM